MKVSHLHSLLRILALLLCLSACVGGGALEGGAPGGGSVGEAGQGQGQPTIQPGADHQPGTPIEPDPDKSASDDIAIPPPEPTEEPSGPAGPGDLTL